MSAQNMQSPNRGFHTVWRLLKLFSPYKWRTMGGFALQFLAAVLAIYHYRIIGQGIDIIANVADAASRGVKLGFSQLSGILWLIPTMMVIVYLGRVICHRRGLLIVRDSNMALLGDLRRKFFDYTQKLAFRFHDETHSGMVISRFTSDMLKINQFYNQMLYQFMDTILISAIAATLMFLTSWRLALVAL